MSEMNLTYQVAQHARRECRFCRTRIEKGQSHLSFYMSQKNGFICETCVDNMKELFEVAKIKAM